MAQYGDWVFSTCQQTKFEWKGWTFRLWQDSHLLAANIKNEKLNFKIISKETDDPLDKLSLPNGLAFTPDGKLLMADSNFIGPSGVARISLDFNGEYPTIIQVEQNWLADEYGIDTPNGVRVSDNNLYVSNNNVLRKLTFNENSEIPLVFFNAEGEEISNLPDDTVFYKGNFIIDDFMPYCDGIAVTHFIEGQLVYQTATGEKYSTLPLSFEFPSALAHGNGQKFAGDSLFVTEKGILRELNSSVGNRVSRINMEFDLSNPLTCQAIKELH